MFRHNVFFQNVGKLALFTACGIQHFEAILYKAKTADETAKLKLASKIQIILKTAGQQQKSLKSLNNFKQGSHLQPCGTPQQNPAGHHQQQVLPIAPFQPLSEDTCECKPFAVPSLPPLRPNMSSFDSNLAGAGPPRNPQWMSKLVDNRSSADAEFHTRFPVPNHHASKSPGRKKKWISQTTSTINSVFDLVKTS